MALTTLAVAVPALAQAPETRQAAMCVAAPVMATPTGTSEDRMLSDDAEVADRVLTSKASIEIGQAMAHGQVVLRAGLLHHAAVEYRQAPTPSSLHARMAEFFYVVDGSADLILGGVLTNPRCLNSSNLAGDGIEGGVAHRVTKGTYILVPENTAHLFTNIDKTHGLTVLNLHVPTPAADQY